VKPYLRLALFGVGLVAAAVIVGGRAAGIGGAAGLAAQFAAVALLRPAMTAPQGVFMVRWLSGMGLRVVMLAALLALIATHRAALSPLPTSLGFLGVLLPLLFWETAFLR
jgi:hypothetical protein